MRHQRPRLWLALALALLCGSAACGPATDRPVRGAVPKAEGASTPPGVPPTLTASEALRLRSLPSPSPAVAIAASPSPSALASPSVVAAPPIVRTIAPPANGRVPAGGPVALSAVLVGRTADLASATMSVNGADAGAQIDKRTPREWSIHTTQTLPAGTHTARVLVRDASGAAGGFTWQFLVGNPDEGETEPGATATPTPGAPQGARSTPQTKPANP